MSHPGWIDPPWIQGVDASAKECVGDLTMTGEGPEKQEDDCDQSEKCNDCRSHKIISLPKELDTTLGDW